MPGIGRVTCLARGMVRECDWEQRAIEKVEEEEEEEEEEETFTQPLNTGHTAKKRSSMCLSFPLYMIDYLSFLFQPLLQC